MYYTDCESLAGEFPYLRPLIEEIDQVLYTHRQGGLFRVQDIALVLREDQGRVSGVLGALKDKSLVLEENYLVCPFCPNLIDIKTYDKAVQDGGTFTCSQCQEDLSPGRLKDLDKELEVVTVYRVNPGKLPVPPPPIPPPKGVRLRLNSIAKTKVKSVRVCLVQLNFSLKFLGPRQDFGYALKDSDKEPIRRKIYEALKVAKQEKAKIICFPELCLLPEWVGHIQTYFGDMIIVAGSYYEDSYNNCPVIINGESYFVKKINPSPNLEGSISAGSGMLKGEEIVVFQTEFGRFVVLICIDFRDEIHRILFNSEEELKNVDFIINPCYNPAVSDFQKQADGDCLKANYPYILEVNTEEIDGKKCGGSCIIGTDHKAALMRYELDGLRPKKDYIEYKLMQAEGEMILIADFDIERKGVPVPARGFKMKNICRYVYRDEKWQEYKAGKLEGGTG